MNTNHLLGPMDISAPSGKGGVFWYVDSDVERSFARAIAVPCHDEGDFQTENQ